MHIALKYDELTALPYTKGTVQNISKRADIEVCKESEENTGLILAPGEKFKWTDSTVYARSKWDGNEEAIIAVVPFIDGQGGGGGGGGSSDVAVFTETIQIPASGWVDNAGNDEYSVKITISSSILAANRAAFLSITADDMGKAEACGLAPAFETSGSSLTLYAVQAPDSPISATLTTIGE